MTAPAAGWFPDPAGRAGTFRWWDGVAWTRVLSDDPAAPAPDAGPGPADLGAGRQTALPGQQSAAAGGRRRVYPPGYEPAVRPARARASRIGAALSTAVVVVVVAIGLLIVFDRRAGSADLLTPPPKPTGAPASNTPADDLSYDDPTRAVTLTGLKLTMPGKPYTVTESSLPAIVLQNGVQGVATVQTDYDGKDNDWVAVVGVGHIPAALVGKDLATTADAVWDRFIAASFSGKVIITKASRKTFTDYPRPVRIINADVHYRVKGVRSSYDKLSVLVIQTPDGYICWISSRPNRSGTKVQHALQASIRSIQIVK